MRAAGCANVFIFSCFLLCTAKTHRYVLFLRGCCVDGSLGVKRGGTR